jgi:hypothetical protein
MSPKESLEGIVKSILSTLNEVNVLAAQFSELSTSFERLLKQIRVLSHMADDQMSMFPFKDEEK